MDESIDLRSTEQSPVTTSLEQSVTEAFGEIAASADRVISTLSHSQPTVLPRWQQALSYLAFEAAGTRLGIEICICIGLFWTISAIPAQAIVPQEWWSLVSWFIACTLIALIDHLLFVPPILALYKALGLHALRKPQEALSTLDSVGPYSTRLIRYPKHLFHLWRSALLTSSEAFDLAARELLLAQASGVKARDLAVARIELFRASGKYDEAIALSQSSPYLEQGEAKFEEALTRFDRALATGQHYVEPSENRTALKLFDEILKLPNTTLRCGLYSREGSQAFAEACKLWTGHAEEGLEQLSLILKILSSSISVCPPIAVIISRLYLARSLYSLTHKEPELAHSDLHVSETLNLPPHLRKLSQRISGDLPTRVVLP